jgi:DNA modification methylase
MNSIKALQNQVHCCSWEDLSAKMPSASVHLVVTSPPYNVGIDYGAHLQ